MNIPDINSTTIVARNESRFLANALGDEIVMMDMDSGDYLGVNSVGSEIWNLLTEPLRVDALVEKLQVIYDVDTTQCEAEVKAFVNKMLEQNMVTVSA